MKTRTKKPLSKYERERIKWYKKLERSGFVDIEYNDDKLKTASTEFTKTKYLATLDQRVAYYNMATTFLNDHKFDTPLDQTIWEYHTNGISVRDISVLLKKVGIKKMGKDKVHHVIVKLEDIMKQLYLKWTNSQGYTKSETVKKQT